MKHKHAFINASPLAFAESGESQRSLVPPHHQCRITTGPDSKASDGPASTVQRDGNCPRVRSAKPRISFPADRVAAGEKETPKFSLMHLVTRVHWENNRSRTMTEEEIKQALADLEEHQKRKTEVAQRAKK